MGTLLEDFAISPYVEPEEMQLTASAIPYDPLLDSPLSEQGVRTFSRNARDSYEEDYRNAYALCGDAELAALQAGFARYDPKTTIVEPYHHDGLQHRHDHTPKLS